MSPFKPSPYQEAIFRAIETDTDDLQIGAVAGSGKTKTIEEAVNRLPAFLHGRTLLTAFNNHIKSELVQRQKRGEIPRNIRIQTIHGIGYAILIRTFQPQDKENWVDKWKTQRLAEYYLAELELGEEEQAEAKLFTDALTELTRLCMMTLTDAADEATLWLLVDQYEIELPPTLGPQVVAAVPQLMTWDKQGLPHPDHHGKTYHPCETVSYDDMIWLPLALNLSVPQYDLAFVDECQDFNRAQQELLYRTGGRKIWLGDKRQAIYGFTGADAEAFDRIATVTGAKRLPLSICYRCAKRVVALAQRIVPEIQAAPDAPEGAVVQITEDNLLSLATNHYRHNRGSLFLLLCRVNAPLIENCFKLIREGVPARVKGRDIGQQLLRAFDEMTRMPDFDMARFREFADEYYRVKYAALARRQSSENQVAALGDRVNSLRAIYDALSLENARIRSRVDGPTPPFSDAGLYRARLQSLFTDGEECITFSSIHKAKGLEAAKVGLLRPDLLPHPNARDVEQERNLAYVAITRAREELYIAGHSTIIGSLNLT